MTKELEALDVVKQCSSDGLQLECNQSVEQVVLVGNSLLTIEKGLKALEIIKHLCELHETKTLHNRFLRVGGVTVREIKSQDEWDLLKEVLNDKNN